MAFLNETFSIDTLPQSENEFSPLPAGWYQVHITGAELRPTKAGTGAYIAVRYDVLGPTHQGRVVFGNLNIRNPNPKAEEIGRQQLGSLMRAIGLAQVSDTDELIGGQLMIKLSIRPADGQYEAGNDVKGYKAVGGAAAAAPASVGAMASNSAPAAAAAASAAPPWARK